MSHYMSSETLVPYDFVVELSLSFFRWSM